MRKFHKNIIFFFSSINKDLLNFSCNIMQVFAGVLVAFFLFSTFFGAYLNFSPVPFTDSWNGMIDFYIDSQENYLAWWTQHNEHRIFFSKLLFWVDMRYFDGFGLLLIPMNLVLLLLSWLVLVKYAKKLSKLPLGKSHFLLFAVLGLFCFAWMQNQNIIWSFQSQFILVYLFPLLSFYCWALALQANEGGLRWRIMSLVFGGASAYCMVNGLAVLPALAVLSWLAERSLRWFILIIACAVFNIGLFLIGYQLGEANNGSYAALMSDPLRVMVFALAYLGGPFFVIFGKINLAVGGGVVAILLSLCFFLRRSVYQSSAFALALFIFISYVFATAGITAYGRSVLPIEFAASSRYLTPVLMMWGAILILFVARSQSPEKVTTAALLVSTALLLIPQMKAFEIDSTSFEPTPHEKAISALSLQLGIDDQNAKKRLHFFYGPAVEEIYKRAAARKVSIFSSNGIYPPDLLGENIINVKGQACRGRVVSSKKVDESRDAYLVAGSLDPVTVKVYRYILFVDPQGMVKGIAIPGRDRKKKFGREYGALFFDGYLLGGPTFTQMICLE